MHILSLLPTLSFTLSEMYILSLLPLSLLRLVRGERVTSPSRSLTTKKYHSEKNFPGFKWSCPFLVRIRYFKTNCKPSQRIVSPSWMKVLRKVYLEENKMEFYILRWRIFVKCSWCYKLFFYFPAWPCKIVDCSISSCYWGGHFFLCQFTKIHYGNLPPGWRCMKWSSFLKW